MDHPSNPKFCENHGNPNTGIPEQNVHVNNPTLTPAQREFMMQQPVYSDPFLQGGNSGSNNSINLISFEQDQPATNQTGTAAETEQIGQRQRADILSADSSERNHHPVNNQSTAAETVPMRGQQQLQLPDISSADSPAVRPDRKRKREADRRYRENLKTERKEMKHKVTKLEAEKKLSEAETKSLKVQLDLANQARDKLQEDFVEMKKKYENEHKQREDMELKVTTFEAENKSLKEQLDFTNQKCETKQREVEKYEKEHASKQTLEAENRRLTDKYIELLEKSNPLVDPRFGTQSKEPGRQHGQKNLSSERDFGSSVIDSITQ